MPISIKIASTVISKAFIRASSLRALLNIAAGVSGIEKMPVGILEIVLHFISYPQAVYVFHARPLSKNLEFGHFSKILINSSQFQDKQTSCKTK
ncbi:hypothetical protein SDC9_172120 [bioreactor metagenome]|uniref:Uncharacterized protein n=1 Tax=bioreactor metagenome TaxID=1076179 RepID=A0A645GCU3_9ZZZZ